MTEQEEFEFRLRLEREREAKPSQPKMPPVMQGLVNLGAGAVRGAGSIGATIMRPFESGEENDERRRNMDAALNTLLGAESDSLLYKGGKLAAEVAGTAGVGGALAKGAQAIKAAPQIVTALQTSGMSTGGGLTRAADLATRSLAGATTGGISAAAVNPEDAGIGALVGGAIPGATKVAGKVGELAGKATRAIVPKASPEVAQLAGRAKDLGIDLPVDRLIDSRPLNAVASSLNYVPLSGRAKVESKMFDQFNRAVSKTIGQDTENMTMALRSASKDLGAEFDRVLTKNTVRVDPEFLTDLADAANKATRELGSDGASIIGKQVDDIVAKAGSGEIDGQAAYNIKKTLDRIGQRNTPEAYYARDLKKALMGALNRSLGPDEAANFAKVRKQYGNMLDLEGLVPNGAEGGLSVGRLANMRGIGNDDLQELADIAGQFLKSREGPHGAAQRVVLGGLGAVGAGIGAAPYVGATMAAGRVANSALQGDALRRMVLGQPSAATPLLDEGSQQALYRLAPLMAGGR